MALLDILIGGGDALGTLTLGRGNVGSVSDIQHGPSASLTLTRGNLGQVFDILVEDDSNDTLLLIEPVVGGATRPSADVLTTGWTSTPGPSFYAMLDEATFDDADFITSPNIVTGTYGITFGLSQTLAAGSYKISQRAKKTNAIGQFRVVMLDASDVVQGASSWQALTNSFAQYDLYVSTTGPATRVKLEVKE